MAKNPMTKNINELVDKMSPASQKAIAEKAHTMMAEVARGLRSAETGSH